MSDYLFQIKKEILRARLSQDEHLDLMRIFAKLGEDEQQSLLDLFRENPEWINKISAILKSKKELFASGNSADWAKVILKEEQEIEGLKEK